MNEAVTHTHTHTHTHPNIPYLREAENVVNKQQHVLALRVAEVLGDRQTRQGDARAGTGGLVHLTVHQRGLGLVALDVNHTGVDHLVVQIVTLTDQSQTRTHGAFSDRQLA
jgi:hypothetical protein